MHRQRTILSSRAPSWLAAQSLLTAAAQRWRAEYWQGRNCQGRLTFRVARLQQLPAPGPLPLHCQSKEQAGSIGSKAVDKLSLIHISEPTRLGMISYAVFCLK